MGDRDAYSTLHVMPSAPDDVIRAVFRALARRFHPDGSQPDAGRMAEINQAYALIRSPELRRAYDARRQWQPVGPGHTPPPRATPPPRPEGGAFARAAARNGRVEPSPELDFGRYMGWSLADLARHDPTYLRWLARHSSGLRYRGQIERLLGNVDIDRRDRATA
jgi:curved DNA-binding protein CbpA